MFSYYLGIQSDHLIENVSEHPAAVSKCSLVGADTDNATETNIEVDVKDDDTINASCEFDIEEEPDFKEDDNYQPDTDPDTDTGTETDTDNEQCLCQMSKVIIVTYQFWQ